AEALTARDEIQEALAALDEASKLMAETGEYFYEAEMHRVRAGLLLAGADKPAAIDSLHAALRTARKQQARFLELKATHDLAALFAERGERRKAFDLLAPLYGTFSEGLDTPVLESARELVDALR